MTRKKVKLSWVVNENSRSLSMKKRRLGLIKKVREIALLCDIKSCLIMFSPNEADPLVWPSVEAARDLLGEFFALSEVERKKKEMSIEFYMKEKTKKAHEALKKSHKKNTEYVVDQLMMQLHRGRRIVDLTSRELYELISFSRERIMFWRKKVEFVQHPPLRDLPPNMLLEAQSEELRIAMPNDVFQGGSQSGYLVDRLIFETPTRGINQQIGANTPYYNENPNPRRSLAYQGSGSSNGNPSPFGHQFMPFLGLAGSSSQPLHHHSMNIDPRMAMMNQPRPFPFAFASRGLEVREERGNINNGDDGAGQEPPPNGPTADATQFDISRGWPGNNNNHF